MTATALPNPSHRKPRPRKERRITVRSVRRDPPDLHLLAKAIIDLGIRLAEEEKVQRMQSDRQEL